MTLQSPSLWGPPRIPRCPPEIYPWIPSSSPIFGMISSHKFPCQPGAQGLERYSWMPLAMAEAGNAFPNCCGTFSGRARRVPQDIGRGFAGVIRQLFHVTCIGMALGPEETSRLLARWRIGSVNSFLVPPQLPMSTITKLLSGSRVVVWRRCRP